MLKSILLAVLLGSAAIFGSPVNDTSTSMECGSSVSEEQLLAMEAHFQANKANVTNVAHTAAAAAAIPVYFHVIRKDDTAVGGNIADSQLSAQVAVLTTNFAPAGLSFFLAGTDRTTNAQWFDYVDQGTPEQTAMKKQLRRGDANALNVYTVGFTHASLLGYATFPYSYAGNPLDDGIVLEYSSLPNGANNGYNTGKILVHETGHWVGLYHTFQGGCYGDGDQVADTPAENSPARDCPIGRDTCPGGGPDPVTNHMDYTSDACRVMFTPGQVTRLKTQVATYRGVGF